MVVGRRVVTDARRSGVKKAAGRRIGQEADITAHRTTREMPLAQEENWADREYRLRLDLGAVAAPEGVEFFAFGGVGAAVGVGAEVVAEALGECGGQSFGAQGVVVGQ